MAISRKNLWLWGLMLISSVVFLSGGLLSAPQEEGFPGEVVPIQGQVIAPGEAELLITLQVPAGYELLRDAPILAKITSREKQVVSLGEENAAVCKQPRFPLRVPLKARTGATRLQVDLVLYYCKSGGKGLCLVKQVRLDLPVRVDQASANRELRVSYKLPAIQ